MLGKGDSDFILGKKKRKRKTKQKKNSISLVKKNTDRQNIGTHTQTIKKKALETAD